MNECIPIWVEDEVVCSESSLSCVLNHITLSTFYFEGVALSVFLRGSFGREDRVRTKTGAQEVSI